MSRLDATNTSTLLRGVPSYHYEPAFAQRVLRILREHRLDAIALELPESALPELDWALSCWPAPVASIDAARDTLFPFVPGDSILEAGREARMRNIPLHAIDLETSAPIHNFTRRVPLPLPDVAFMRAETLFDAAVSTVIATGETPCALALIDDAREAHMARRLCQLLDDGRRVLWVGGAAHWTRLQHRVAERDFQAEPVEGTCEARHYDRVRLSGAALHLLTGCLAFMSARYAESPDGWSAGEALGALASGALQEVESAHPILIRRAGAGAAGVSDARRLLEMLDTVESRSSSDAARVLLYARNLAATSSRGGPRETPELLELLESAIATIGPRYAGRVFALAMHEASNDHAALLPVLEFDVNSEAQSGQKVLRLQGQLIGASAYWRSESRVPSDWYLQALPSEADAVFAMLPRAANEDRRKWRALPPDAHAYREFVRFVFRVASQADERDAVSLPFVSGLREGLDVRATLRFWHEGRLYVREERPVPAPITNAAIDWKHESESESLSQSGTPEARRGGWIDPSEFFAFGSCSRQNEEEVLLSRDPYIQLARRDWTLLTLDAGTYHLNEDGRSFYDLVIKPLVSLPPARDDLYAWLEKMFSFCAGKSFAYFSRYVPGPKIHRIAARHRVRVLHVPLSKLPELLCERQRSFRFMALTRVQWEAINAQFHPHPFSNLPWGRD